MEIITWKMILVKCMYQQVDKLFVRKREGKRLQDVSFHKIINYYSGDVDAMDDVVDA